MRAPICRMLATGYGRLDVPCHHRSDKTFQRLPRSFVGTLKYPKRSFICKTLSPLYLESSAGEHVSDRTFVTKYPKQLIATKMEVVKMKRLSLLSSSSSLTSVSGNAYLQSPVSLGSLGLLQSLDNSSVGVRPQYPNLLVIWLRLKVIWQKLKNHRSESQSLHVPHIFWILSWFLFAITLLHCLSGLCRKRTFEPSIIPIVLCPVYNLL